MCPMVEVDDLGGTYMRYLDMVEPRCPVNKVSGTETQLKTKWETGLCLSPRPCEREEAQSEAAITYTTATTTSS